MIWREKYENKIIDPTQLQFYFDGTNQLVEIYPCRKVEGEEIKYLLDENGERICDIYDYAAIQELIFREGS